MKLYSTKYLKIPFRVLFCFTLFALGTSFLPSIEGTNKENKWLPEDFNPKDIILLIQDHPFGGRQTERLEEYLEKEYHWRYEIVSLDQFRNNKKYDDKKLYKFAMLWTNVQSPEITTGSHGFTYNDIDGHFIDRSSGVEYPRSTLGKGYG